MDSQANDSRPLAMLEAAWGQYRAAAATARKLKTSDDGARNRALWLGFLGAASSTLAGWSAGHGPASGWPAALTPALSVTAAVLIALAGYVGRELLSPTREDEWVRCRSLAEALKQAVFKALMSVPPYIGREASDELRDRVVALLQNTGLLLDAAPSTADAERHRLPAIDSIEDYLTHRVREQIAYYSPAVERHKQKLRSYRRRIFALGVAATVMSTLSAIAPQFSLVVPLITTATAALATVIQASRLQGIIPLYQETASQLSLALASWQDDARARANATPAERRAAEIDMIARCEEILGRESEAWRAEWKRGEEHSSVDAFLKQVENTAPSKASASA